jgi:glycosyltransferase involved in cell wall biosynthesis
MARRVLMIAYHFPPGQGSSGVQRTLRFAQHLPAHGWEPVVLTVVPRAHPHTSEDLMAELPAGLEVLRAQAWDSARHFAVAGRYPGFLARPDRWQSWRFDGLRQGLARVRRGDIDLLWSTFPIATAHAIGAGLAARTGLPWVADFRDPMLQRRYPADPANRRHYLRIEAEAATRARWRVFTTPGALAAHRERFPVADPDGIRLIPNGHDEASFEAAARLPARAAPARGPVRLLHSGIVYTHERDPAPLLRALALLRARRGWGPGSLRLSLRASHNEALLERLARAEGVADQLELLPPIGYADALREMLDADALLLMQGGDCNAQIPAKAYEYLRAGRPLLALADPDGDTARLVREAGLDAVAPPQDSAAIAALIERFMDQRDAPAWRPCPERAARGCRRSRTRELAALFDEAVACAPVAALQRA